MTTPAIQYQNAAIFSPSTNASVAAQPAASMIVAKIHGMKMAGIADQDSNEGAAWQR